MKAGKVYKEQASVKDDGEKAVCGVLNKGNRLAVVVGVWWLAVLACDGEVPGLIPATSKLFQENLPFKNAFGVREFCMKREKSIIKAAMLCRL